MNIVIQQEVPHLEKFKNHQTKTTNENAAFGSIFPLQVKGAEDARHQTHHLGQASGLTYNDGGGLWPPKPQANKHKPQLTPAM